ncbi:MAG: hypothetical protein A3H02_01135 [Candidatus Niyogibacteria bacterium RIFCSPLOWO2_12_FULL_41_13]|uniref:Uncharacterized protein n=1 Tax=Candidatus Niyogibacteria bacterium RIFCSPLOWO2_12_FULL_41_13 TaxID=1801726 RepID=A0A1G2F4F2_9BACT|nr:MAG: hypothetical protein A3H02_01135 [Candidatus Niyogibacteria bacterium RIFCSPLOWO2_12_FULL_41_13]
MRFLYFLPAVLLFGLTRPVFAQNDFYGLINNIIALIINPIILFLLVLATLVFLWGAVNFIKASGSGDEEGIGAGKKNLVWGLIGMFIMLSVKSIIFIIQDFFTRP